MSEKNNRLDMIEAISMLEKYSDYSIFDSYIPKYYAEIYSLYNLLIQSGIYYNDIKFSEPLFTDGSLSVNFNCKTKDYKSLKNYIKDNPTISFLRKNKFNVYLDKLATGYSLIFNRI